MVSNQSKIWNANISILSRFEIDLAVPGLTITDDRNEDFTFLSPICVDNTYLLSKKTKKKVFKRKCEWH